MISKGSLRGISENREILVREENFVYLLPCEHLRGLISNFTITFPDRSIISDDYTIMPHGSVTLVMFSYKDEVHSFLFGPAVRPQRVGDLANKCDVIFIIEFQPGGFFPFTEMNQKELTNRILPFSVIDYSLDKTIMDIFGTSVSAEGLLLEVEQKLIQGIRVVYPEELSLAVETIIGAEGVLTSDDISNKVFYSQRHLNRLFNFYLGMSMKAFSGLVRINKAIRLLSESTNTVAYVCEKLGYYDVSHFVRDFRVVCDITPQEYRTNMSSFYSEIAKF